jgi:hypothetical protein
MTIPEDQIDDVRQQLTWLIDERTSAQWASYSDEEIESDQQDLEDIQNLKTVLDVLRFLRDQGDRTCFVEWASCLDPLSRFVVDGKDDPDAEDETAFRDYLQRTYDINQREFPLAIDSEADDSN